jgi:DNA-binding NarL/FixJ family response regulator
MECSGRSPCRILLADDQAELRSALRLLLEEKGVGRVTGEAADAAGLLSLLGGSRGGGQLVPRGAEPDGQAIQVVLLDWELPGLPPEELLNRLRRAVPYAVVLALSSQPEAEAAALEAGADGFVSKGQPPERLLEVLEIGVRNAMVAENGKRTEGAGRAHTA